MVDYTWPHNVRELRLVSERLALLYPEALVHALRLPPELQEGGVSAEPKNLQELVARLERDAIAEALRQAGGKKIRAAEMLGISRPTLDKKIQDYALNVAKGRRS
jgi:DNA-binding NtrC family response regulator